MLAEGRLLVPYLHGQPYCHKPPLLYWLIMASYRMFGIHDWAARLVPCSAGWCVVLVTYYWARRSVGTRAAFAGALILALSARFIYLGRMLTMDSLLCLWVILGWMAAHLACQSGVLLSRWWVISALACGLGLMTKGPVALVLVAVPVVGWQLLDERIARPRLGPWVVFAGIALGFAAPWYAAITWCDPSFAGDFLWIHNLVRYVAPLDHLGPVWYYLPGLLLGMMPWTLVLPFAIRFFLRRSTKRVARPGSQTQFGNQGVIARPLFFLLAFAWCLVFYSLAGCKRPGYILPAVPPLALALGCYLEQLVARSFRERWAAGFNISVAWHLGAAITFAVLLLALYQIHPRYVRKFSLRAQVVPQLQWAADPQVPVVCFPHRWDSVSYYLLRNDVCEYTEKQRNALLAALGQRSRTLLFIKSNEPNGRILHDLLQDLPPELEFVPLGRPGMVTAGMVIRRKEIPLIVFAQR